MQGTVKFFHPTGRYGFVEIGDGNLVHAEYFFHENATVGRLPVKGDEVSFLLDDDRRGRGLIAIQVKRISYPV